MTTFSCHYLFKVLLFVLFYVAMFSLASNIGAYQEANMNGTKKRVRHLYPAMIISVILLTLILGYMLYLARMEEKKQIEK